MAQYSALPCVFGIWQNSEKLLISNGLRFVVTCLLMVALWVLFHLARHSYATSICLANGVSMENVAKMLGHADTSVTKHYARVLDQNIFKDMQKVNSCLSELAI